MSQRDLRIVAFGIAVALTMGGFKEVCAYKWVPPERIALWFPVLLIFQLPLELRLLVCLAQFPMLATAFSLGVRRWKAIPMLCLVLLGYAMLVAVAFSKIESSR